MHLKISQKWFFEKLKSSPLLTKLYKQNLKKSLRACEKLLLEKNNKSNEIINSFDINYQKKIESFKKKINVKKNILVIGMGGSSAGAKAINSIINSNIFFFDNYDLNYLFNFFQNHNLKDFSIFVISKSGYTFETLAMLNLTYQHLNLTLDDKIIRKNIFIITEKTDNPLYNFAKSKKIHVIEHNINIGGRFSVFSQTATILFNINPRIISQSANCIMRKLTNVNKEDHANPAVNAAIILSLKKFYKIKLTTNIIYDYPLKNYSYWFHQLFAESLGKNNEAITPTTSICPKDYHSMAQLYLSGPKNKLFNIYEPEKTRHFKKFSRLNLGFIEKTKPNDLRLIQYRALLKAFDDEKIPYRIFSSVGKSKNRLSYIFELFAYNIIETIILAYAQNLNPYDQPAVEQIKKNTISF